MPNGTGSTSPTGGSTTPVGASMAQTVVVQLKPVCFQISLHYLSHDRIAHSPATYRCKYEVVKEGPVTPPPFVPVKEATAGGVVTVTPSPPVAGEEVTIDYRPQGRTLDSKPAVHVHFGFNNWTGVTDANMQSAVGIGWRFKIKLPSDTQELDLTFFDGGSIWDNNDGKDWKFPVRGAEPCRNDPATTALVLTAPVANIVRHDPPLKDIPPAAKPMTDGGDMSNLPSDEIFRIVILDNHAMADGESTVSSVKTDCYTANQWMPAVSPAVPFRVVLKKFLGTPATGLEEVDVTETLKLMVEIKDPREEFDQNCGSRRQFAEKFFNKYNVSAGNADSTGTDNGLVKFGGKRDTADHPGLKASRVLKVAPYNNTPVAAESVAGKDSVTFASLTAATDSGKLAEVPLELKDGVTVGNGGTGKKIGVADVVFLPPPVSGDNYRFLFSIKGGVGDAPDASKDIREQKANGADVTLLDDDRKPVAKGACYTTGRFVIWRQIEFALQINCNGVVAGDIDWNVIKANYLKSFIQLVPPKRIHTMTWQEWRDALREVFDSTDTYFNRNPTNIEADFNEALFPGRKVSGEDKFRLYGNKKYDFSGDDPDPWVHAVTKKIIEKTCTSLGGTLINPVGNNQRNYPDGMYMLFAKSTRRGPDGTHDGTLGEYIKDRVFYMFPNVPANPPDTTDTCSHELGHALYLSHSFTSGEIKTFHTQAGTDELIGVSEGTGNGVISDHDQHDSCRCLMSYVSSMKIKNYPYDPCGVCNLVLRFYPKSALKDNANYGNEIKQGLEPDAIWRFDTGDNKFHDVDSLPPQAVGDSFYIGAFGKERPYDKGGGGTWRSRVGLSALGTWSKAGAAIVAAPSATPPVVGVPAGNVSFPDTAKLGKVVLQEVMCDTAGRVEIKFTHAGQSKSFFITIT